ncbi:uncharacterized protein BDW47DRAFT_102081 [Aspergillus candidus]|uniref:Uncharacterized protein n=1 Tax=Aspergillus candidus TaxID=41067 RepID=A0A2I2FHB1_ASPCN|nr:hypothetical protein BDW47DRAFT_102081 [Aspergillus candidus]PLB40004.1 hypothetical protein BDW47DRAFT_102081 [Aspergillus candidus]
MIQCPIYHTCGRQGKQSGYLKAACTMHLLWPVYIVGTAHTASNSLRDWIVSNMDNGGNYLGI